MNDDVNIVAWAWTDIGIIGAEVVSSRELVDTVWGVTAIYTIRESLCEHFAASGIALVDPIYYAILEPSPPFKILKEGSL